MRDSIRWRGFVQSHDSKSERFSLGTCKTYENKIDTAEILSFLDTNFDGDKIHRIFQDETKTMFWDITYR